MGCKSSLRLTSPGGLGFLLKSHARLSSLLPTLSIRESRSAATTIAAGFSTTRPKEKRAAGAAAKAAATANAFAAPAASNKKHEGLPQEFLGRIRARNSSR